MVGMAAPARRVGAFVRFPPDTASYTESGVLSTGGDVVFAGGVEGNFVALDARTGELLWHVNLGGPNASGPIIYAVEGKQYIVGTGQGSMFVFGLPDL